MSLVRLRFRTVGDPTVPAQTALLATVEREVLSSLMSRPLGWEQLCSGSLSEIAEWLGLCRYEHVVGSNGYWRAP